MATLALSIPVGSWHPLFPAMLRSLAVQPRDRIQLALLDASGDPRVSEAAQTSGLQFAYVRRGPDAGQSAAIEEGWAALESDWVGWLNADDLLAPDAIDQLLGAGEADPLADVVFGDSVIIDADGTLCGVHGRVAQPDSSLLRSNLISQPSCIARRSTVEAAGGLDESLHFVMDWDLWVRLFKNGARFRRVQGYQSAVHWGDGTKTSQLGLQRMREFFGIVARHGGAPPILRAAFGLAASVRPDLYERIVPRKRRPSANGVRLSADKNFRDAPISSASLPLINIGPGLASVGEVRFLNDLAAIEPTPFLNVTRTGPGLWRLEAAAPIAPAHARHIHITCRSGQDDFLSARWLQ